LYVFVSALADSLLFPVFIFTGEVHQALLLPPLIPDSCCAAHSSLLAFLL
jgi:hypothetical protein